MTRNIENSKEEKAAAEKKKGELASAHNELQNELVTIKKEKGSTEEQNKSLEKKL